MLGSLAALGTVWVGLFLRGNLWLLALLVLLPGFAVSWLYGHHRLSYPPPPPRPRTYRLLTLAGLLGIVLATALVLATIAGLVARELLLVGLLAAPFGVVLLAAGLAGRVSSEASKQNVGAIYAMTKGYR
jgi:hypothetical protein